MSARSVPHPQERTWRAGWWALLVAALVLQAAARRALDPREAAPGESSPLLFISSGATLRHMSLGYEGLLADVYWTRAVQYYGRQRLAGQSHFELLGPLLRITTTLDPHLIAAYRFGAIFLAERPPAGAGHPQEALQLLRKGAVANPEYWRLWEDMGFIYYWDLHDYASAARTFRIGSERPGAALWMKTLAAAVAAKGGELRTSQALWFQIYRTAENDSIRKSAIDHLAALKAVEDLQALDHALFVYKSKEGRTAASLNTLVAAGFLRGIPLDPSGRPYVIGPGGKAALASGSRVDLRLVQ
ncbi:MAG: hypothetical protein ACRD1N_08610 [Terriglobia bacterium]